MGIRGRLFLAFGFFAAVTGLSSAVAWFAYEGLTESLERITKNDIPVVWLTTELAEGGRSITATAPSLMAASNESEREAIWKDLNQARRRMESLVARIERHPSIRGDRNRVRRHIKTVADNLDALDQNVRQRFWYAAQNHELTERLRWAHADFLDEVEPLTSDARFNIALELDRVAAGGDARYLSEQLLREQETLLKLQASVNLLVGLVFRATSVDQPAALAETRLIAGETVGFLREQLKLLGSRSGLLALHQSADVILDFAHGKESLFALRAEELRFRSVGRDLLGNNAQLVRQLQNRLGELVTRLTRATVEASEASRKVVARAEFLLLGTTLGSILVAILVVWLYVGRNLVRRITELDNSMRRIAEGDLQSPVPTGGKDEIAEMANALVVFRDTISGTKEELVQAGKLAALGQLSAGIAHELNQPLAAIRNYAFNAGLLLERGDTETTAHNLAKISSISTRMADKINHLKKLARRPSGEIGPVKLGDVFAAALELLQTRIRDLGVEVVQTSNASQTWVQADAIRLEQVLLNLLGNSLDAMEETEPKRLTLACVDAGPQVVTRIVDTGHGIAQADMARVFDPFFTTKEVGQGLGLGLSISYNIVKDLGGTMKVWNEPGEGTIFSITLKRANP